MLDFRKPDYWPTYRLRLLIFHHYTKFGRKFWSTPKLWPKTKFKMANAAILNLFPMAFLIHCRLSTININQHAKRHASISIYDRIIITFWNSTRRQPAMKIFENLIYHQCTTLDSWFSIIVPNLVQKLWSTPTLWRKFKIQDGGPTLSWICENLISDQYVALSCWCNITYQICCKNVNRR